MKIMGSDRFPRSVIGIAMSLVIAGGWLPNLARAQHGASDVPDLTAIWTRSGRAVTPTEFPLNARGLAMREAFDEFQHPMYYCAPAATPHIFGDPYNLQIEQLSDRVIIHFEKEAIVRTIWLEGHGHPAAGPADFSIQGYSTGHYEDGDLVAETTHYTYDPSGIEDKPPLIPASTAKRTVERYSRDGDRLTVDIDLHEPLFLTEPLHFSFQFEPTDTPLVDWLPCDPSQASNALRYIPQDELKYGIR
jgi:hypothetical protein